MRLRNSEQNLDLQIQEETKMKTQVQRRGAETAEVRRVFSFEVIHNPLDAIDEPWLMKIHIQTQMRIRQS